MQLFLLYIIFFLINFKLIYGLQFVTYMKKDQEITSLVFNDLYQIDRKISEGSFGTVYCGVNLKNSKKVAIKVEKSTISMNSVLYKEAKLLKKLQGIKGIPQLYYCGQKFIYKAMVLDLLGLDLLQYFKKFRRFSLKTVCKIAYQLIRILQSIHDKGIVHRDLKPENIATGIEDSSDALYLIDFGIAKEFLEAGRHIPYQEGRPFLGTIRFASLAAHKGIELSRKDDLESLGYLLVFFLKGKLPWQSPLKMSQKDRKQMVLNLKEKTKVEELCLKLPQAFNIYMRYVKNLSFKEIPNYAYLKGLFMELTKEKKIDLDDNIWDWNENININFSLSSKNATSSEKEKESLDSSEKILEKISSIVFEKNMKETLGKIEEEKSDRNDFTKLNDFPKDKEM